MKKVGTRKEVFYGKASKTSGGLTKDDLIRNKRGTIVSKKLSEASKRRYEETNGGSLKPFTKKEASQTESVEIKAEPKSQDEPPQSPKPPVAKKKRSKKNKK